jgi:hypothetical protein
MNIYNIKDVTLHHHNAGINKKNKNSFTINDFSRELIDLINEVYQTDFVNFGYDKK